MSDKTRRLYPLTATFSPGEQPSAAKLSALSTQAKAGIDRLEFIVGDLWNAAGDQILSPTGNITTNALHIPNIARSLGRMAWLNPTIPGHLDPAMQYYDDMTSFATLSRGFTQYAVASPSVGSVILSGTVTPLVQGQFKANPKDVQVTGDWSLTDDGQLFTFNRIPSGLIIKYTPNLNPLVTSGRSFYPTGKEPGWNVIPDPSTWGEAYDGLKISFANNVDATGGYHIWMPPRMPLGDSRHDNKMPNIFAGPGNIQTAPDSGTLLFFQDGTSNASMINAQHYRYLLPDEITAGAANSKLPTGYLYLWDETFGTIIDNVACFTPANTAHSRFKIRVTSPDLVNVFGTSIGAIITDDTTQIPGDYKSRFKLIVVGTSLAKAVSSLIFYAINHSHKLSDGGSTISHSNLGGLVTPPGNGVSGPDAGHAPPFVPSPWPNDDHPQYLHRWGSIQSYDLRDPTSNAMFRQFRVVDNFPVQGDFVVNQTSLITNVYSDITSMRLEAVQDLRDLTFPAYMEFGAGSPYAGWTSLGGNTNPDTILARGGGDTGVFQMINGQFQRMYLNLDTNYTRGLNYLEWDDADEILSLVADTFSSISAPNLRADQDVAATRIQAAPSGIASGFQYSTPRTQYLNILGGDLQEDLTTTLYSRQPIIFTSTNTGTAPSAFCQAKFPDGVTINTSLFPTVWTYGNGTTGVTVLLKAYPKQPSGVVPGSSTTTLLSFVGNATATWNKENSGAYGTSHIVDNSPAGYVYVFYVTFPIATGGNNPAFGGIVLPYSITTLNN